MFLQTPAYGHASQHELEDETKHLLAMMRSFTSLAQSAFTKTYEAILPLRKTSCMSLVALRYSITVEGTLALGDVGLRLNACSAGHLRMLCELTEYRRLL